MRFIYFLLLTSLALPCFADMDNEPHDIVLRAPATETQDQDRDRLLETTARIDYMIDVKSFSGHPERRRSRPRLRAADCRRRRGTDRWWRWGDSGRVRLVCW